MNVSDEIIGSKKKKKKYTAESIADDIINGSYESILKKRLAENEARNKANIARSNASTSTKTSSSSKTSNTTSSSNNRTWFSSGAFSDGYQIGDVTKTILGTAGDIGANIGEGINRILEGTVDAGAYLIGGAAKLIGQDEFADKTTEFIKQDTFKGKGTPTGIINNVIKQSLEGVSVTGDKTDSLIQSAGQLAGTIGLQAVGVPWWVTTGTTSFGSGTQEAFQDDATYGQAGAYGLISAGSEILTEKLSGGISFGGKTLDDVLLKPLTEKITGKTLSTLVNFGIDALGEGTEEILASVMQNIGKKLTYENEKTWAELLTSEAAMDEYLEGFIGGAVLGGGFSVVNSVRNNNDIAPIDQTAQAEGLQQEIVKKQEELKQSQDAREKQIIQEELNILNEELYEATNTQQATDEKELRKQNFVYQAQETDSDIKKTVYESASQVMNNTEKSHKFVDVVAKIAEEKGTTYRFTNNEQLKQLGYAKDNVTVNGLVNENGEVLINIDSAKALNTVVGHETTHLLEGTKEYDALKQVAIEYAKTKGDYDTRIESLTKLYEGTNADIEAELTSDIVGEYLFTDENFIKELSIKQPTVFERIRNFISDLVVRFKGTDQEKQLRQLQRSFEKAYKAQSKQASTDTKYSIQGLESYTDNEIKSIANDYIQQKLEDNDLYDVTIKDTAIHGSRGRGTARADSDLDIVVEFEGDIREDDLFSILNEDNLEIDGIKVDINPITANDTGTLKDYMARSKAYDKEILAKLSTTDNKGKTLSKEQQDFFKDSKVRDENGNLLTMYHGTRSDFNVFDMNRAGQNYEGGWSAFGKGFYFTPDIEVAKDFSTAAVEGKETQVKEVFLNITNPFYIGENYSDKLSQLKEKYNIDNTTLNKGYRLLDFLSENGYNSTEVLQELGYDGVIDKYNNKIEEAVVFNSNQIKNVDNTKPTSNPDIRYSLSEDTDIDTKINSSMTMEEAKDMIQRAFMLNNIYEWYDGKYKNGEEWLSGQGVEEVALYIENSYQLQDKYLNKIYDRDIGFGDEFFVESIVEAYQNGTLTGTEKQTAQRLDVSKEFDYPDNRFYAPQEIQAGKELYEVASQRVTNANRQEVYKARANFIIAAHNKGFAEAMGLTQEEVSKKLKSWANYTKKAMELSNSLNEGVAFQNRWSGIENSSIVNTISISNEEMGKMVKEIKGDSSGWQRQYITSTMLALDTHIDYSNLTFEFEAGQQMSKNAAGQYFQDEETIRISHAGQNTVAHEIGHYLDHKWASDLGFKKNSLTDKHLKIDFLNEEQQQFVKNFRLFIEDIENSSYLGSEYGRNNDYVQRSNEVFARFVGKFTEWVKNQATNNRYGYEDKWYKDNFTERQYKEFVKILQEKSMLDAANKKYLDDLRATINALKGQHSLSAQNEDIAPRDPKQIYGEDVKLQVEEAIAPLQEKIETLTEQLNTVVNSTEQLQENIVPVQEVKPTQPTLEEVQNLMDIRDNKSGSEYARAFYALRDKYGQVELYKSLNEYYSTGTVTQPSNVGDIDTAPVSQEVVEQQNKEAFANITDEQAPSFEDVVDEVMWSEDFESTSTEHIPSPLDSRDIDEVGNRKVKAYQYENPEVKPYFQQEAQNMIYDLDSTIKGERIATHDQEGYITGWNGITRQTTEAIAYLKDNYGYSYDQIRQGLNKIIEDDGLENNAVSKRIEFMLDERLREGYTTSDGIPIPPNQEYINFLNEKQITQYNKEAFNALTDEDIPLEITPEPQESATINQNTQSQQTIPMKKKPAQNQNTDVPEGKVRKWAKTSTESETIKGKILISDLDAEKIHYVPITNKGTLNQANTKLGTLGYSKAVEYFNNQIVNKKVSVEDIALGERLIQEAIQQGDKTTAAELIQNVAILGTELGQKVQALSIIQRLTPAGQLKMLDKTINRGKVKGDQAFNNVELTKEMKDKILDTYNQDGTYDQDKLNKAVDEVKQELADQMEVTTLDKVNAWRYLSMLGNPKTHIRNLVSNVAMRGTVAVKNAIARTIEGIAPIGNRTKTWESASEEVINFAKKTALEMKDVISGDSKYSETADIKAKRKIFKSEVMNKLTGMNSDLLEKEDWWFSKPAFENSLSEFLTANGIKTEQDIQNNPEIVEKGKVYATEQAQIATFRQYSWLANKINDIERKNTATQIGVGAVLPFKKTPINIAKTGLSYSPIGALKSLTYDIAQVKQGKMEASTAIDHIAQGATGTALTLIGYMLAQMGFLNGAGDDDKEGKYDSQLGKQAYSINIGGNTYSLSWLSPVAMPLLVGANAYEQLVEGEEWNTDVVLETLGQTLDPLSEMSFLSSLDAVLSSYDSGVQRFFGIGEAMAQNYITQFVPTALSQLAATLDDTKRSTKVSGDSDMKVLEETYNKLIYKIPGLRETLEPTLDIWGNEVKQSENLLQRAFENFISPYSRKENIATEIDEELKDLYAQTGDTGILPSVPYNYVKYDGERYDMSAEEYTDYKKTYGQTANDLLEDLFRTTTYQNATSEDRADMVNKVYDYARDEAKLEYLAKEDVQYTNAKKDGEEIYRENLIKGAIENDMTPDEYELYVDDPEEYSFLKEKDYSYRRKYFDTNDSLKKIEKSFEDQKEGVEDDDELDALYSEKKANIVDSIINSGLEDTEKASLYKKYYNSDTVDTIVKSAISVDDYLTYETKEFKADKNEKGNSIPGSRKDKVINYVNTLDMSIAQKAILIKSTNTFKFNDYNSQIVEYVGSLDIDYEDMVKILKDLDMTVQGDTVYWD